METRNQDSKHVAHQFCFPLAGKPIEWKLLYLFVVIGVEVLLLPTRWETDSASYWTWGNFFLMPMRGLPYSDVDLADFFAQGSLTAIEKWITPHILRSAWASWGYEELSDQGMRSLRLLDGHDP